MLTNEMLLKSGVQYEEYVVSFLKELTFNAKKTGNNDGGIDIVCTAKMPEVVDPETGEIFDSEIRTFMIQCKFHNRPVAKAPVQEVYTGVHFYDPTNKAFPVVITNNRVTFEARTYARKLGVEIIADTEWAEIYRAKETGEIVNPNQHTGLMGLILSKVTNNREYLNNLVIETKVDHSLDTKEELKLQLISDFDEAEEHMKEAAYLQDLASKHSQKAVSLQKRATLAALEHG